jgi:tetraacyldisaccharide 4'-kinase
MRAPRFWHEAPGPLAYALMPIGIVYGIATAHRMRGTGRKLEVPVICVGNFTAGGTGKTPVVAALADWLKASGKRPVIVSRGYGGHASGPISVDPARHAAAETGDEPLMLARHHRVVVSRDRAAGCMAAIAAGAEVLVLDDGLQNPAVQKDMTIAVVDGSTGIGNGFCIPAGPLRAPLPAQWPFVSDLVVMGSGPPGDALADMARERGLAVHRARLEPDPAGVSGLRGKRVFGFAGIGRPAKFRETLVTCGATLAGFQDFGDHHAFSRAELAALASEAQRLNARPVTTEKDLARIGAEAAAAAFSGKLATLPVRAVFTDDDSLREKVERLALTR